MMSAGAAPCLLLIVLVLSHPNIPDRSAIPGQLAPHHHHILDALQRAPLPHTQQEDEDDGPERHAGQQPRPPRYQAHGEGDDHHGRDGGEDQGQEGKGGGGPLASGVRDGIDGLVVERLEAREEGLIAALGLREGLLAVDLERRARVQDIGPDEVG